MPSCFSASTPGPSAGAFFFQGWSAWVLEDGVLFLFPTVRGWVLIEIGLQGVELSRSVSWFLLYLKRKKILLVKAPSGYDFFCGQKMHTNQKVSKILFSKTKFVICTVRYCWLRFWLWINSDHNFFPNPVRRKLSSFMVSLFSKLILAPSSQDEQRSGALSYNQCLGDTWYQTNLVLSRTIPGRALVVRLLDSWLYIISFFTFFRFLERISSNN